jgi:crossover junction endodeoxyribonuclease RuvC
MLALGIDPGTATTGFGLVRMLPSGEYELVSYGTVLTEAGQPMPERLSELFHKLGEVIQLHQPDTSAVEQLFFQTNVKTAISVGQARGVAILALAEAHLPVGEYTPLQVKQAVTGYGKADKRQVQEMVRVLLKMEDLPKPDDAADALAVAICHLQSSRLERAIEAGS